jgi:glyoxylase-like metal-dependent hydrolase (beta-lactamase superfamily II)
MPCHALMVGMSENWWRSGIMPCLRSDLEARQTDCLYFLAHRGTETVRCVVDTGYNPDYVAPEWAQGKNFIEPPKLLAERGVRADEIKTVIVTHFHQDHFTGMDYFPTQSFVMQHAELEFWTGPLMRHEVFDKQDPAQSAPSAGTTKAARAHRTHRRRP